MNIARLIDLGEVKYDVGMYGRICEAPDGRILEGKVEDKIGK